MTTVNFKDLLEPFSPRLAQLGVDQAAVEKLAQYLDHLWSRNQDLNLVSRKLTPQQLVADHLMDSLIALPLLPDVARIVDLGTGGGFPAIPLAICRPKTTFLLFEKSPLKCKYLQELIEIAPNIEVKGMLGPYSITDDVDLVIARAFKPIGVILDMTRKYHENKGRYFLYKARLEKIREELHLAGIKEKDVHIQALESAGDADERHIVSIG